MLEQAQDAPGQATSVADGDDHEVLAAEKPQLHVLWGKIRYQKFDIPFSGAVIHPFCESAISISHELIISSRLPLPQSSWKFSWSRT